MATASLLGATSTAAAAPARDDVVVLDEPAARGLAERLDGRAFTVTSVETKPWTSRPKPPFITSSLQQVAGSRLRMSSSQVMSLAQGLYERGYITYMRTDSVTLSDTALKAARAQIEARFGRDYLHDGPRVYRSKAKNAQEAHEAIRPAGDSWRAPNELRSELRGDELRVYELDLAARRCEPDGRLPRSHRHRSHRGNDQRR